MATKKTRGKPVILNNEFQTISDGIEARIIPDNESLPAEMIEILPITQDTVKYPFRPAGPDNHNVRLSCQQQAFLRSIFGGRLPTKAELKAELIRQNAQNPDSLNWLTIFNLLKTRKSDDNLPDLLPLREVVKYFYTTVTTLKRQIKEGLLKEYRKPDKRNHVVSFSEVANLHERKPKSRP